MAETTETFLSSGGQWSKVSIADSVLAQGQRVGRIVLLLGAPGKGVPHITSSFWGCQHSLAGSHITPVSASVITLPSLLSVSGLLHSLSKDTCGYICGPLGPSGIISPSHEPMQSHPQHPFFCRIRFRESRCGDLLWGHYSAYHTTLPIIPIHLPPRSRSGVVPLPFNFLNLRRRSLRL